MQTPKEYSEKIKNINSYPDLQIEKIEGLVTFGKGITELLSNQFVNKVISLINMGNYKLVL